MHLFLVPLVALGALATPAPQAEPGEGAMRIAFETRVARTVASALDFVAETGGDAALEAIKANRTDFFALRAFHKTSCDQREGAGYRCAFRVEIDTVAGAIEETISGWFYPDGDGLVFADET